MNDIDRKDRGTRAANLLADPLLQEALIELKFIAHRAFESAGSDVDKLKEASALFSQAVKFQRYLAMMVKQGEVAAKEIERELNQGKFVRGVGRLVRNRDESTEGMPWSRVG